MVSGELCTTSEHRKRDQKCVKLEVRWYVEEVVKERKREREMAKEKYDSPAGVSAMQTRVGPNSASSLLDLYTLRFQQTLVVEDGQCVWGGGVVCSEVQVVGYE